MEKHFSNVFIIMKSPSTNFQKFRNTLCTYYYLPHLQTVSRSAIYRAVVEISEFIVSGHSRRVRDRPFFLLILDWLKRPFQNSEKNKEEGERKSTNQSINFNKTAAITFKMAAAGVRNKEIVYDKAQEAPC